tara:strand:+ start:16 stop:912 length:897 start_codon:yes stop_codon:yes gene_type:complete
MNSIRNLNKCDQITIIIVLYKETAEIVFKTLQTIKNFKIIIIDNGGDKFLKKKICQKFNIEKYILNPKNKGFSAGYNQGIFMSKTTYTMVLNPDCIISEDSVILLSDKLSRYNEAIIVSPRSFDEEKKLTFSSGLLPENGDKNIIFNIDGDTCVENTLGSCMLFRTEEVIKKNLFFDEFFFLYFSDDDLCRRIKEKKRSIIQVYNASCVHSHGKMKVKNIFKRTFLREFHFTFDRFYYFFKINKHHDMVNNFKKKKFNYIVRIFLKLITFQFVDSLKIISKLIAFSKFIDLIKKKRDG